MKYLKKFLCLMLSMLFIITTFSGCSTLNPDNIESNITKGEWFNLLKDSFGFETNEKNVVIENEKDKQEYTIRSLKSWDVIGNEDANNLDDKISRSYALATAVYAVGEETTKLNRQETSEKKAADFAVDNHIGESKSFVYMNEGISKNEAEKIIEYSIRLYHSREIETFDKSIYKEDLQVEKDTESYRIDSVNNTISVDSNKNKYKKGDIVLFGEGVDAKVVEIKDVSNKNGKALLDYKIADIEQYMESVDVSGSATVEKASDVKTGDGCKLVSFNGQTLVGNNDKPSIDYLGTSNQYSIEHTAAHENPFGLKKSDLMSKKSDLGIEVSLGTGGASIQKNFGNDLNASVEGKYKKLDENGKEIDRDVVEKWESGGQEYKKKAGFKITGKINIDDFSVDGNVKYDTIDASYFNMKKWKWDSEDTGVINPFMGKDAWYYVKVNSKVTSSLSIEGYISEEIKLCTVPVAIGPVTITVDVKLKQKYNGKLEVSLVVNNSTEINWNGNRGFKNTSDTTKEMDFTVEASYEADLGLELGIGIGGKDIVDCGASIGFKATVSFKDSSLVLGDEGLYLHGGDENKLTNKKDVDLLCYEISEKFPVVKVSVNNGDSIFATLDKYVSVSLGGEWTLTEGMEFKQHVEHNKGLVDECTKDTLKEYDADDTEESTEETTEKPTENIQSILGLQLDTYAIDVLVGESKQVNVISLPNDCDMNDIDIMIDDESIATARKINNGISVTGISDGTATLTVYCKASDESMSVTVIVTE